MKPLIVRGYSDTDDQVMVYKIKPMKPCIPLHLTHNDLEINKLANYKTLK